MNTTNKVAYNVALLKCCPDWLRLILNRESLIPVVCSEKDDQNVSGSREVKWRYYVEAEIGSTYTGKCWCHSTPLFKFGTGTHGICIWRALVHAFDANLTTWASQHLEANRNGCFYLTAVISCRGDCLMWFTFSSVIVKTVPNALFYVVCGALTQADRYSTKMASEGASGEQPPPIQTLATAIHGGVEAVRNYCRIIAICR